MKLKEYQKDILKNYLSNFKIEMARNTMIMKILAF